MGEKDGPRSTIPALNTKESQNTEFEKYDLKQSLGQGSFGLVKLAFNKDDDKYYAMKCISKKKILRKTLLQRRSPGVSKKTEKDNGMSKVYREIAILKKLDHENVVRLVEVLDDSSEDNMYMVFEYHEHGEVMDVPTDSPFPEQIARKYFIDCILGLEFLHYNNIIHRDIKPANLLLGSDGHVKIADFGVSVELDGYDDILSDSAGTPAFQAPESLREDVREYRGYPIDVWATGITLYCFLLGDVPFRSPSTSILALHDAIRSDSPSFPDSVSPRARDLIGKLLCKDPSERITIEKIREHSWLTSDGVLPSRNANCKHIEITEDDIKNSVTQLPSIKTIIMVRSILKRKAFLNPFKGSRK